MLSGDWSSDVCSSDLAPAASAAKSRSSRIALFFIIIHCGFYGRCTGGRTTAKVSRIVGIGLSGKNGSKGTKKQENGKEYEKNKQIRTRKSPGVREIRRTKKPRPRRTEGVN